VSDDNIHINHDFKPAGDLDGKENNNALDPIEKNIKKTAHVKPLKEVWIGKESFFKKLTKTATKTALGQNTVGRILGIGLDVTSLFIPQVESTRRKVKDTFNLNQQKFKYKGNMNILKKAFSLKGIKEFFKYRDENGNFSWEQVGVSLLQIAVFIAVAYV